MSDTNETINVESKNEWFKKEFQYLKKATPEKRYNAAKNYIWLSGIVSSPYCKIEGCSCRTRNKRRGYFCRTEIIIFTGVREQLEKEFKKMYPRLNTNSFGVQFFIRQIAMNSIRLFRAFPYETQDSLLQSHSNKYYETPIAEYIRRLINQTIKLLRGLGLAPLQQIEKESWTISKTLEKTIAKMQIKPSEVKMEKSVAIMKKKPK